MPSTDSTGSLRSKSCDMLSKRPRTVFCVSLALYFCSLCVPYFNGSNENGFVASKAEAAWVGQGIIVIFALGLAINATFSVTSEDSSFPTRVCAMPIIAPLKFGTCWFFAGSIIYSFGRAAAGGEFGNGQDYTATTAASELYFFTSLQVKKSTLAAAGFFMLVGACAVGAGQILAICRSGKDPDWLGSVGAKFTIALLWLSEATIFFTYSGVTSKVTNRGEKPFEKGLIFAGIFALSAWILSLVSAWVYSKTLASTAGIKPTAFFFIAGLSTYCMSIMTVTWGWYANFDFAAGTTDFDKVKAALILAGIFVLLGSVGVLYGVYKLAVVEKTLSHALFLLAFSAFLLQQAVMCFTSYQEYSGGVTRQQVSSYTSPQGIFLLTASCCLCTAAFFLSKEGNEGADADKGGGEGGGAKPPKKARKSKKKEEKQEVPNPAQVDAGADGLDIREPAGPPAGDPEEGVVSKRDSQPSWMVEGNNPEGNV